MPHTERDIDTLARTIWGEARTGDTPPPKCYADAIPTEHHP